MFESLLNDEEPKKQSGLKSVTFENTDLPDVIELKNIRQTYDGGETWVIDNVNILIESEPNRGQFVCLLGASGCGKTTLLNYITGLQTPTEGEVLIKGEPRSHKHRIGMVFQKYSSLPHYSVRKNVGLGLEFKGLPKKEIKERVDEILEVVGLSDHAEKYAQHGILSGGQLQRVAIARNLILNPEIIMMDEPFGALDVHTRHAMQDFLAEIWEKYKNTIIFITHDIEEAVYLADDIWIMRANPGKVVKHMKIKLPYKRDRETKRSNEFRKYSDELTDIMFEVNEKSRKDYISK